MTGVPEFFTGLWCVAFFLNLLYEMLHSVWYTTCLRAALPHYVYLMLKGAVFDASVIVIIYYATLWVGSGTGISGSRLLLFCLLSLLLAWIWEWFALRHRRWEYSPQMPRILGVGVTPLAQLTVTGLLSLYIAFQFL